MPSSWVTTGGGGPLIGVGDRLKAKLRVRAAAAMSLTMIEAVEDMKRFTASRPGLKTGKAGRVETAAMLEAIAERSFFEGVDRIVGEFGFLNRKDLYFMLQTSTGFTHYLSGDFIEPTFAMRDAATLAMQNLFNHIGGK